MEINFLCDFCGGEICVYPEDIDKDVTPPADVLVSVKCLDCDKPYQLKIAFDLIENRTAKAAKSGENPLITKLLIKSYQTLKGDTK